MVQVLEPKESPFGRIGKGIGQGLSEQLPKEMERGRLAQGLQQLSQQQGLTPFQQFAGLASLPGTTPQIIQSGGDFLRQQALINSVQDRQKAIAPREQSTQKTTSPQTATTVESTESALNPYIPPSGEEQENMARELVATEPLVYPTIEAARQAINNRVAANIQQSNEKIKKRELEEQVQSGAETKLKDELKTVGAEIPGRVLSGLQQDAVKSVRDKKMTPDEAKVHYGKIADSISKDFANVSSWGNLGLVLQKPKELLNSIDAVYKNAKKYGFQKEAADHMIAENGVTPGFAYATMKPVKEIPELNKIIKDLPEIKPKIGIHPEFKPLMENFVSGGASPESIQATLEAAPTLVKAMGLTGSPLAIGYEIDKKGLDSTTFKNYVLENADSLNLSTDQLNELGKPKPSYFGWLNDWWLKSFSGVK